MIIHSYPREVKPFYIRLNDDKKTVAAFDLVVPKVNKRSQTQSFETQNRRMLQKSSTFVAGWCCDHWEPKRRTARGFGCED